MASFTSTWPLPRDYAPPVIGNGTLAMQVDLRCSMEQMMFCRNTAIPTIVRTGYRYDDHPKTMVSFGYFETADESWGAPVEAKQTLDARNGLLSGWCRYAWGLTCHYEVFCRLDADFVAFKLRLEGGTGHEHPVFRYMLNSRRLTVSVAGNGRLRYELDGLGRELQGEIGLLPESDGTAFSHGDGWYRLDWDGRREAVWYLAFGSTAIETAQRRSFGEHQEAQRADWNEYFSHGCLTVPDKQAQNACDTGLYYLRVVTTPWSIPTGLIPSHWNCRYFCFDEFFSLLGLLRTGHFREARHVPEFRLLVLPQAQRRYYNYDITDGPAHYPWESGEDGLEATSDGYWQDHCFEHAHVVLSCFEFYRYTNDLEALRRFYPVIRACVLYLQRQRLVQVPGKGVCVGIVTDLERLGPSHFNPFMTGCSFIAGFEAAAQAATLLGVDEADAKDWENIAASLRKNLPQNDERYLAYPDAKDTAIGMVSGIHPYSVLPVDDPKQLAAVEDFITREAEFGCMLKTMGKEICTWYSAWKTLFFARRGDRGRAAAYLQATLETTGHLGECFESNRHLMGRPWFATASAAVVQAVTESLFQATADTLKLGPAVPDSWHDYEFTLAAPGDLKVHCKVVDGAVVELDFQKGVNYRQKEYMVVYPDGMRKKMIV